MLKKLLLIGCLTISSTCFAVDKKTEDEAIKQGVTRALNDSIICWNTGNLDCFMDAYVNDNKTLFISDTKFLHGWQQFYDHYKKKYGNDKKGMGHLEIDLTEIEPLDSTHAFAYGRWHLKNNKKEYNGVTSLIFVKKGAKWQIMVDHSNS